MALEDDVLAAGGTFGSGALDPAFDAFATVTGPAALDAHDMSGGGVLRGLHDFGVDDDVLQADGALEQGDDLHDFSNARDKFIGPVDVRPSRPSRIFLPGHVGQHTTFAALVSMANTTTDVRTGRVKWYNSRKNHGFIVDLDTDEEVFVHADDLCPKEADYKTLYTGEYVEFKMQPSDRGGADKAAEVTGIRGGTLLCDMGHLRFTKYSRMHFSDRDPHGEKKTPETVDPPSSSCPTDVPTGPNCA